MNDKVGVLGSGVVGVTLANGLKNIGYTVQIGNRKGSAVKSWSGKVGTFSEVAADVDMLVLAIKGSAAETVVSSIKNLLALKIVIDTTNPIADKAPEDGVLSYFTSYNDSLMERLQTAAPEASFVKAFNSVGNAIMVNPKFENGKPSMFICGNNSESKVEVEKLLQKLGWESVDCGGVKSARAIEPLCMLWCLPGMLRGEWNHAFKFL